jgi:hypothetical protein
MSEHDNPIIRQGLLLTEAEYEVVLNALTAVATAAEAKGEKRYFSMLKSVCVRLKQHTFAGDGVPPSIDEAHRRHIAKAISKRDPDALRRHTAALLAVHMRMSPDPASSVATIVFEQLASDLFREALQSGMAQETMKGAVAGLLKDAVRHEAKHEAYASVVAHLGEQRDGFEQDGWLPDNDDPGSGSRRMFEWVVEVVTTAADRSRDGLPAFDRGDDEQVH